MKTYRFIVVIRFGNTSQPSIFRFMVLFEYHSILIYEDLPVRYWQKSWMPGTMLRNGNVLGKEISIISCLAFNKSDMTLLGQIICCKFQLKIRILASNYLRGFRPKNPSKNSKVKKWFSFSMEWRYSVEIHMNGTNKSGCVTWQICLHIRYHY